MKYFVILAIVLCVVCCDAQSADEEEKPFSCTPLERFSIECNQCYCGPTGKWAECGVDYCDPEDKTKKLQAPKDCKDNDRFYDGCNDCFCANGQFACTLLGCHKIMGKQEF